MTRVEPAVRRAQIGRVVWDLVRTEGVSEVSVRNVAARSGLSVGSLRHYFPTQSELIAYSMQLATDGIRSRINALIPTHGDPAAIRRVLEQVLPLDAARRAETEVWLSFTAMALTDTRLKEIRDTYDREMRVLCATVIDHLCADLDQEGRTVEVERLHALLDGLAVQGVMYRPAPRPAALRRVLARHLGQLGRS